MVPPREKGRTGWRTAGWNVQRTLWSPAMPRGLAWGHCSLEDSTACKRPWLPLRGGGSFLFPAPPLKPFFETSPEDGRGERLTLASAPRGRRDLAAGTQSWRVAPLCGKALAPPATTGSVLICSFFNCTPFLPAPIRSRRGSHVVVRHSAPVVRPRRSSLTAFLVVLCIRPCATLCYDVLGYAMLWYVVLCG